MKDLEDILREELKDASILQDIDIPEEVDQRIMAVIDAKVDQINEPQTSSHITYIFRYAAAAAAVAVLCGILLIPGKESETLAEVDIVDAYMLASRIEARKESSSAYDLNADGIVDHLDVDQLARKAVMLSPQRKKES